MDLLKTMHANAEIEHTPPFCIVRAAQVCLTCEVVMVGKLPLVGLTDRHLDDTYDTFAEPVYGTAARKRSSSSLALPLEAPALTL